MVVQNVYFDCTQFVVFLNCTKKKSMNLLNHLSCTLYVCTNTTQCWRSLNILGSGLVFKDYRIIGGIGGSKNKEKRKNMK